MNTKLSISIVVPVWNEEGSLPQLIERIHSAVAKYAEYEIIAVDDHSNDTSVSILKSYETSYPIKTFTKRGARGKAQSITEGVEHATYPILAMIDADLQYPPEAIVPMAQMIDRNEADVIVGNRKQQETSKVRKFIHTTCRVAIGKVLHGFDVDIQSGLKVFKKEVAQHIKLNPSPWAFDLEFLVAARSAGFRIGNYDILFAKRTIGDSKINLAQGAWQIGVSAVKLKLDQLFASHSHKQI
jgi:dolichol-phosphate mannosyltransferase